MSYFRLRGTSSPTQKNLISTPHLPSQSTKHHRTVVSSPLSIIPTIVDHPPPSSRSSPLPTACCRRHLRATCDDRDAAIVLPRPRAVVVVRLANARILHRAGPSSPARSTCRPRPASLSPSTLAADHRRWEKMTGEGTTATMPTMTR